MEKKINDAIGWIVALAVAAVPLLNWAGVTITADLVANIAANTSEWLLGGGALAIAAKAWGKRVQDIY